MPKNRVRGELARDRGIPERSEDMPRKPFPCDTASWSSATEWVGPRSVAQEVPLLGTFVASSQIDPSREMIMTRVIGSLLGSLPNRRPRSHNDREPIAVPSERRCRPFIGADLQSRRRGRAFRATGSARTAPVQQTSNLGFRYFLCESFYIRLHWRLGRGPLSPRLSGRATRNCARSWACDRRHDRVCCTVRGIVSHTPASIKTSLPADNQTS